MGGGGLMQLVAYGAQDVYLTGNPQITFFKSLYRRHTSFSIESIEQTFQGSVNPGSRITAVISRNGDLLHRMFLEIDLPSLDGTTAAYVQNLAHTIVESAEIEIGGQRIDKVYGRWMTLWKSLTCKEEKKEGYKRMTGSGLDVTTQTKALKPAQATKLFLPLDFWFSKGSAGQALPLIALQYHEVRVTIQLADVSAWLRSVDSGDKTVTGPATALPSPKTIPTPFVKLFCDFIYLDTEERRRFAQVSHEYLIEQLQFTGVEATSVSQADTKVRLNFNHPCKLFAWMCSKATPGAASADPHSTRVDPAESSDLSGDLTTGVNPVELVGLQLNGHERFKPRSGEYFTLVQPYQHFTRVPTTDFPGVYSFCISPEEHQPSGALNMSRVDNAQMTFTLTPAARSSVFNIYIYAVNYNVLRILSGMGGLAFSN